MNKIDLNSVLSKLKTNLKADWIGLREVKETTTHRIIRDLKPATNNVSIDHGIMVEVLINGQLGYCGTHNISYEAIKVAADKAYGQAFNASKFSLYPFTEKVRPQSVGKYNSPYLINEMPLDELMDVLIESNKVLRKSKKIVSAISMARVVNMDMKFIL